MGIAQKNTRKYISILWLILVGPLVGLTLLIFMISWGLFGPLPTFEDLENPKSNLASVIYSSDQEVIGKYYFQNRTNTKYGELSPNLVNALLATEDIRYEDHTGIDVRGLMRVLFKTILLQQKSSGGGSTLTQQLAKNLFPRNDSQNKLSFIGTKLKEWITAIKLERNYTKEEIMAMYLNTVEFGSNAYGIKSAAQIFYNVKPSELSVVQSAVLVGLLKAPTYYSPVRNPENSTNRRNTVLAQMEKYEFITKAEFDSLSALPLGLEYKADDHNTGLATYFREVLRLELNKWCKDHLKADGQPYNIYRDGLKIYTTIDSRMQRYAEEAVKEQMTDLQKTFDAHWKGKTAWKDQPQIITDAVKNTDRYREYKKEGLSDKEINKLFDEKVEMKVFSWQGDKDTLMSPLDSIKYYKMFLQTGFMAMEPQTGYVKAWVGGNDYNYFKYDHVKEGRRQVGSTFKPFLYTLAIQEGYSPCYKVSNVPVTINLEDGNTWTPKNSDGKYGGMLSLKEALAESVNTISAYLIKQFGPTPVIELATKMGLKGPMDAVPSIALGTPDVSLMEMVGAYGTFANKGVWTQPIYITRIEDKNGVVLQEFIPRQVEAISEETAYITLNLLQGVVQYGTGVRLRYKYNLANPIAGKTGTSQNNSDGWFMGITPDLVGGAWVGCEDRSIHFRSTSLGQGANTALPIWALFMKKVYSDKQITISTGEFEKPQKPLSIELNCDRYKEAISSPESGGNNFGF
ncbi:MAG TPA: transglycosylase domain-containing protein [Bacteroidia bacterium]|nr:transglycosylase domain-containing protein [Bacteroidia bacterium]HNT79063.1 transglycosylase domain-containing protein [Bacteroidia bacterium]